MKTMPCILRPETTWDARPANCIYFFLSKMGWRLDWMWNNTNEPELYGNTNIGSFNMEDGKIELHVGPNFMYREKQIFQFPF